MDFITISRAFLPYCGRGRRESVEDSQDAEREPSATHLVVKIEPAEISGFRRPSVSVSERSLLQRFYTRGSNWTSSEDISTDNE